jgi:hypothetical protein
MGIWIPFRRARYSFAVVLTIIGLFLIQSTQRSPGLARAANAPAPQVKAPGMPLEPHRANGAIQDKQLLTAFPIENVGNAEVTNLRVTETSLHIGVVTVPGTVVGGSDTIEAAENGASFGSFPSSTLLPTQVSSFLSSILFGLARHLAATLTIVGTCEVGGSTVPFTLETPLVIAPDSPGSAKFSSGSAPFVHDVGGPYPAGRENPSDEANEGEADVWVVPIGPVHSLHKNEETSIEPAPPPGVDPPLEIYKNDFVAGGAGCFPTEPSGATNTSAVGGGVVFVSFNCAADVSIDGGKKWQALSPLTMFPPTQGGFCCDQIVEYVPSIDLFVWLMQYWATGGPPPAGQALKGPNLERIAVASPTAIIANLKTPAKAWQYFDLTPGGLGLGTDFFDYPDLSVGDNSLYASFDDVGNGLVVVRVSLKDVGNGYSNRDLAKIPFEYTHPSDSSIAYGCHLTQHPGDSIFWAGNKSNSSIRVFSAQEGSNTYSWQDIDVGSWSNNANNFTAPTPDKQDWLTFMRTKWVGGNDFQILGSTRAPNATGAAGSPGQLYFAWTAAGGNGFPQPQVQWVTLGTNPISLITQRELWSSNAAVAFPALSTNSNGEVGVSAETGGGGKSFENHAVGFLLDNTLKTTTKSDVGTTRYGDYVTIRPDSPDPTLFDAFGYGLNKTAGEQTVYVLFGRPHAPTYDEISIALTTGNDDAASKSEIIGQFSGQQPICLKQSDSRPPDSTCPGNGNSSPSWDNWSGFAPPPFPLSAPQTSAAGFGTLTITLLQADPTCDASCDNWDLQAITVTALDSTKHLSPIHLLQMSEPNTGGNNCIARLKGPANNNSTSVEFGNFDTSNPTHVYSDGKWKGETTNCSNNGD